MRTFICAPVGDPSPLVVEANCRLALGFAAAIENIYGKPAITWAYDCILKGWLDDGDEEEREVGVGIGRTLLASCDRLCVLPGRITPGMEGDISLAIRLFIPIHVGFDSSPTTDIGSMILKGHTC